MRCDQACAPVFARHETFHPRYGWLKKAYDAAVADGSTFNADDAVVTLGVGKNMVRSIRFWAIAYGLIAQVKGLTRVPTVAPTAIGHAIFDDEGWDPFCELIDTQWLLHWWLLAPTSRAPAWWLAFNDYPGVEFTADSMEEFIRFRVEEWTDPHPSSIKKDVSCLLRMYATAPRGRSDFGEALDSPSSDLGLILSADGVHRFSVGAKSTLTPEVVTFACLDFIARTDPTARTATLARLATEPGAPGRSFKLTEACLEEYLRRVSETCADVDVVSVAGSPVLAIPDEPEAAATELLRRHYHSRTGRSDRRSIPVIAGPGAVAPLVPAAATS